MEWTERWRRGTKLYWAFFRVGAFTFGGGYAMLPLVEKEFVSSTSWMTREDVVDSYALAQTIPGVIAVNTALLIGHRLAGVFGAFMAGLGVIIPSIVIIIFIATFFGRFIERTSVVQIFQGVRAGVVALIAYAAHKFARSSIKNRWHWLIVAGAFLLSVFSPIHVILIMAMGGIAGLGIPVRPDLATRPTDGRDKL